jgi:hypothetical protein
VNLCALERISAPDRCKLTYTFQDMAAHSACDFGGGRTVQLALAKYGQVVWPGILLNPQLTDEELWNTGRCMLITLIFLLTRFDSFVH